MSRKVAALFVAKDGPYIGLAGVEAWTQEQDAKKYTGPWKAITHPPCERWGRYWSGGPSAKVRRQKGDDEGCFRSALESVRRFGGLVEHPAHSHAWKHFDLPIPSRDGGWSEPDVFGGRSCHIEQGNYGHKARKATWLYAVGIEFPEMKWGVSSGIRLDEGFHSTEERRRARAAGIKPIKRLSERERIHTPMEFVETLLKMVRT